MGLPRNSHKGPQPSPSLYSSKRPLGVICLTKCVMIAIRPPRLLLHLSPAVRVHPASRPATVTSSHRMEKPRVQLGDETDHRAPLRRDDVGVEAPVPRLDFTLDQDHLRFRICRDEILGKGYRRRVGAHSAIAAQQLVPVGARETWALAQVFGVHCLVPHVAVANVGKKIWKSGNNCSLGCSGRLAWL